VELSGGDHPSGYGETTKGWAAYHLIRKLPAFPFADSWEYQSDHAGQDLQAAHQITLGPFNS
jgi:hypothetical protein